MQGIDLGNMPFCIPACVARRESCILSLPQLKIVDSYAQRGQDLGALVARIKQQSSGAQALVTVGTAHKAKGLEWPNVMVWDDFQPLSTLALGDSGDVLLRAEDEDGLGGGGQVDADEVRCFLLTNLQYTDRSMPKEKERPDVLLQIDSLLGPLGPRCVGI